MNREFLLEKISEGKYTAEQLITWVKCLPSVKRTPTESKVGDVYMHPIFHHPYVLLKNKGAYWICGLLTSESKCPEILEPTKSRFFPDNYFTKTIFTASEIVGSWINTYDNPNQLRSVLTKLNKILL